MYVHITCETNHIASPRLIKLQNSRERGDAVRRLEMKAMVAPSNTTFCRMSPKAVRAKLRGIETDTATCTHTSVHNPISHFRPSVSTAPRTLQIVGSRKLAEVLLR